MSETVLGSAVVPDSTPIGPASGRPNDAVDWGLAANLAAKLSPPGPRATRAEAAEVVAGLRQAALDAVGPVFETTLMTPAHGAATDSDTPFGDVFVVDRPRWSEANTQMMRVMTQPMTREINAAGKNLPANRVAFGTEIGGILGLLSTQVLGQFDPYSAIEVYGQAAAPRGRLLLNAPNILAAQRRMKVVPKDFWLWVALHEQTHGMQFAAAPWLTDYLIEQIDALLTEATGRTLGRSGQPPTQRLMEGFQTVRDVLAGATRGEPPMVRILSPDARKRLGQVTAVMSLLEGHADVMMDAVGQDVVPTVGVIRSQFEKSRDGLDRPRADLLLRRLVGMNVKLAQYREGAAFVRAVEEQVGRDGLNAVWVGRFNLPTFKEIGDPSAWVKRVHG